VTQGDQLRTFSRSEKALCRSRDSGDLDVAALALVLGEISFHCAVRARALECRGRAGRRNWSA